MKNYLIAQGNNPTKDSRAKDLYEEGNQFLAMEEYEKAIDLYNQSLKASPNKNIITIVHKAFALNQLDRFNAAVLTANKALEKESECLFAKIALMLALNGETKRLEDNDFLLEQEEHDRASIKHKKNLKNAPDDILTHKVFTAKNYTEALVKYDKVLKLLTSYTDDDSIISANETLGLIESKEYDKALKSVEEYLAQDPNYLSAWKATATDLNGQKLELLADSKSGEAFATHNNLKALCLNFIQGLQLKDLKDSSNNLKRDYNDQTCKDEDTDSYDKITKKIKNEQITTPLNNISEGTSEASDILETFWNNSYTSKESNIFETFWNDSYTSKEPTSLIVGDHIFWLSDL